MNITKEVDKFLESPHFERQFMPSRGHHPSQASCIIKDDYGDDMVAGKCLRASYWNSKGVKPTNPFTARSIRIMQVGKMVERFEVEQYKRLGIWRANNIKFFNERYGISGEADAIIHDDKEDKDLGVEIKTGYDYMFRKEVIGSKTRKGRPKLSHLLQTMIYVNYFKMPFRMVYIDRGNAARAEYEITLNNDGTPNVDGRKLTNGVSLPGCISRFKEVAEYLDNGTTPPRDFQLQYGKEKVQQLYDSNQLSKKRTQEFEKNKRIDIGDWNCGYCSYKDYCWKENKNE